MSRIKGFVLMLGGVVILMLGIGMWKSPEINWDGFIGAFGLIGDEFARLKDDPFAILGILIIIVGAFITYQGVKKLIKG
ncbi:MAG: hypothetical protein PHE50_05530 [Dehalococcoidales bacterium]|nr:hypothetical protein [Dehalococcoidales bacterium]